MIWSDISATGTSQSETESNEIGRFEITGKFGKGISIRVEKEGYRDCDAGLGTFEYADPTDQTFHEPDPLIPVAFHLTKKGPPEPMVKRGRMELRCAEDSGDLFVDLLGYREVKRGDPSVDLAIHAEHGPIRMVDGGPWFTWKIVLSVPNGGIQAGSECPPSAPEDGYRESIEFKGDVEGRHGQAAVEGWFFLRCHGGQHHARVWMKVLAAPSQGGAPRVYISEYVLNPSGSRNLEFYPDMQVEAKYYVPKER